MLKVRGRTAKCKRKAEVVISLDKSCLSAAWTCGRKGGEEEADTVSREKHRGGRRLLVADRSSAEGVTHSYSPLRFRVTQYFHVDYAQ